MGTNPVQAWSFFSGLIFTIAQVVFMTEYFFGGFDNLLGLQGEVISHKPNRSPEWPGFSIRDFFPVAMGFIHLKAKEAHLLRLSF